jgi:hypothetical protein
MHAAVLLDEKFSAYNAIRYENSSLTWLYKAAPAFPINSSKVCIETIFQTN